jgi:LysR family hca operon transcriptional activator
MELRHLRYFIAVAEELNFTRAAERLHTAQPSLSQQIRDLEDAVGCPLFFRTKRYVELTDAGRVFLGETRLTLAQVERSIAMARKAARAEAGHIVIGFVPSAEVRVFPRVLPVLRARYPDIKVVLHSLSSPEQRTALLEESINVAFLRSDAAQDEFVEQVVLREPLVAVMPVGHPLSEQDAVSPKAFERYPYIGISEHEAPELRAAVNNFFAGYRFTPTPVQCADNVLMALTLVGMGLGVTVLPNYVENLLFRNVIVRPITDHPRFNLVMASRKDNTSSVVETFRELVRTVMLEEDTDGAEVAQETIPLSV